MRRRTLRHKARLNIHQVPAHLLLIQIMLILALHGELTRFVRPSHAARGVAIVVAIVLDR